LVGLGIEPCIPGRANRKAPVLYDTDLYKQRNRIERMVVRLKEWRRIATRYDRCAHTFMSAICIAATVIFWLWVLSLGSGPINRIPVRPVM
jgi:transposase